MCGGDGGEGRSVCSGEAGRKCRCVCVCVSTVAWEYMYIDAVM